jgi:hypothetical protein
MLQIQQGEFMAFLAFLAFSKSTILLIVRAFKLDPKSNLGWFSKVDIVSKKC